MTEYEALKYAVEQARLSPCIKSKRGVIIWDDVNIHGLGFNSPPDGFICQKNALCRQNCSKYCIHAEQAAILNSRGVEETEGVFGTVNMLHVKILNNEAVSSGGPSCIDCSKLILGSKFIEIMWLLENRGDGDKLYSYTAKEFHTITMENIAMTYGLV